jgi:hypothetical protein
MLMFSSIYKLRLLLCICIFAQSATAQWKEDFPQLLTLQTFGLHGNVSHVEEVKSESRSKEQKITITKMVFDKQGRIDSLTIIDTNKQQTLKLFHYENDTLVKSIVTYSGKKGGDSTAYLYSPTGRLRDVEKFSLKGSAIFRMRYRYDSKGRLHYIMNNDGNNRLVEIIRFRYPTANEYVRARYNDQQQFASSIRMMHTKNTEKDQWTYFYYQGDPDSCVGIEDITFNRDGQETHRVVMTADRRMIAYATRSYNASGHVIAQTDFSEATESELHYRYDYQYDQHGNWINLTLFENEEVKMMTARQITYRPLEEPTR